MKTSHTLITQTFTTGSRCGTSAYHPFNRETIKMIHADDRVNGVREDGRTLASIPRELLDGDTISGVGSTYQLSEFTTHSVDDSFRYGTIRHEYISFGVDGKITASFRQDTDIGNAYVYAAQLVSGGRNGMVYFPDGCQLGIRESLSDGPAQWLTRAGRKPRVTRTQDDSDLVTWWHRDYESGDVNRMTSQDHMLKTVQACSGLGWYGLRDGTLRSDPQRKLHATDAKGPLSREAFADRWLEISCGT